MPQATSKDPAAQRAQDKEAKRARGALSCAECRRLKLKCDKTVPCSSCKRRGCSAICPNGSLITGQGTRFVLADTEKLHEKIAQMSDRIRLLEDALTILHNASGATDSHPLLDRDSLKIKSIIELHAAVSQGMPESSSQSPDEPEDSQYIDAFGTLAIRDDGASTFYGRSAGQEGETVAPSPEPRSSRATPNLNSSIQTSNGTGLGIHLPTTAQSQWLPAQEHNQLPPALTNLSQSFPLPAGQQGFDLDYLVDSYLPPWDQALNLCNLYLEQAPWFFGAVTRRQLFDELLPMWYNEAPRPSITPSVLSSDSLNGTQDRSLNSTPQTRGPGLGMGTMGSVSPPSTNSIPPSDIGMTDGSSSSSGSISGGKQYSGSAHDLALLFVIFCFGALTDMTLPPAPDNHMAEHYYDLTKVSLALEGVLDRPPSVSTVQTLSLMGIYEGLRSAENSIETTWALFGMATKLAQSIGLHRDCARWKLSPAEVQKRRALFWELFITDCWQSLATGRLATFSLPFVDCELPADPDQTLADDGSFQPSFPFWKARFGAECVAAVVQGTLTSRAPKYSIILELDRKVRDMDVPKYAQGTPPEGVGLGKTMSHFMPTNYRELTLLYIHRCFFTHAIRSNPSDPIKSQYAPSFLAGYRSACDLLGTVKKQFSMFPKQIARFWVLWTHAFSATIMLSSVVLHGSKSKVAPAALLEVRSACDLFEKAAAHGGRAVKFLPIIQRLQAKAQKVFFETCNGVPPPIPNDILKPSSENNVDDEMSIFGGKTHTVTTKVVPLSRGSSTPKTNGSPRGSQSPPTGSPLQSHTTTNPSFAGVHPSLVSELNGFDGIINAQIQNAYKADSTMFTRTLMQPQQEPREEAHAPQIQKEEHEAQQQQEQLQYQRQEEERQRQLELEEQQRKHYLEEQELHRQEQERLSQETYAAQQRQQGYATETYPYKPDPAPYYPPRTNAHPESSQTPTYASPGSSGANSIAGPSHVPVPDQKPVLAHSQSHPNLREQATEYSESAYRNDPYQQQSYMQQESQRSGQYAAGYTPSSSPVAHYPYQPQQNGMQNGHQHPAQASTSYKAQTRAPRSSHAHQPYARSQHQHSQRVAQPRSHRQAQQEMYPVPASYVQPQQYSDQSTPTSPETEMVSPVSSTHQYTPASYEQSHTNGHAHAHAYHSQHQHHSPVTPVTAHPAHAHAHPGATPPAPAEPTYWQGNADVNMPYHNQQHQHVQHMEMQQPYQQYTPEGAMRGIAADDPRLQETWQSFMYKVGTPHMLED
ncbi:hypothetical protein V5O48_003657 [Marasmius crinis-equi]|uniref:Zn(2)-C6 fungal-type domain-containing protein n=1 Tax=Marasmius crinis-equi TaxID=585013 RepID=A0ABR3FSR2_9AGAR